jgi:hypothetical protein
MPGAWGFKLRMQFSFHVFKHKHGPRANLLIQGFKSVSLDNIANSSSSPICVYVDKQISNQQLHVDSNHT